MGVLLLGADDYGTLAAARCYGRNGIKVSVADQDAGARARFSRYVDERLVHPPLGEPAMLVDWLVAWGERHPGTLIYPSNDHLAWLFATERERLGRTFQMLSPGDATVITLLDKMRLSAACREVGIETPDSVALGDSVPEDEAEARIEGLPYPLLIKPRIRVLLQGGIKGFIVHDRAQLGSRLARFRKLVTFHRAFTERHPDIAEPIVQQYLGAAETSILSVAGFVGGNGDCAALASLKMLQRPRKVGIGLCFEGRALEEPLLGKVAALCRKVGYQGAFEAEFVIAGERRLLIDFNPRFYSQMGFEVARGLPVPLLVWYAARGEGSQIAQRMARTPVAPAGRDIYCHKTMLDLMLVLQRLSGRMSGDEVERWRGWHRRARRANAATDAVRDPADRKPAFVDAARWIVDFARHPRSFVNSFVLNR
jgi:D-aspartate ligase